MDALDLTNRCAGDDEDEDGNDGGEEPGDSDAAISSAGARAEGCWAEPSSSKKKKKKKKKNKGGAGGAGDEASDGEGGGGGGQPEKSKEVDEEMAFLDSMLSENQRNAVPTNMTGRYKQKQGDGALEALLAVDKSCLNAEKEMRRLFGANAVAAGTAGGDPGGFGGGRGGRGGGGRGHRPSRKTSIITPREHWPAVSHSGIGMVVSEEPPPDGSKGIYYDLTFSEDYMSVQALFAAMAATHDPQNIVDILRQHPYHLDSLLQMSEIYTQMGEQQVTSRVKISMKKMR